MKEANIGKLLPVDGFVIKVPQSVQTDMSKSLSHLYQPLIGVSAVSLYQTLLSEYDLQKHEEDIKTHHLLMNYLHMPLDQIFEARQKLEAIGLLRTFIHDEQDQQIYSYVLLRPFTPNEFFDDDMLSLLLYHHLGSDKFERLRKSFYHKPVINQEAKEITSSFEQVFSMNGILQEESSSIPQDTSEGETKISVSSASGANVQGDALDFRALEQSLQQRMLPVQSILSDKHKKVFSQLAILYNLATYEMEKAILWSLNDANELIVSELKEACHDIYQNKNHQSTPNPTLTDRREKIATPESQNVNSSNKEEALIKQLEEISPRELLQDLSEGVEPTEKDLKIIREIMTQQGLSAGVMNVLIYYVLLKTDMKMSKPYMETIAGHWTRLKVKTVRQAMEVAKTENRKYQQWATNKKYGGRRNGKQEVLPDWFKEQKEKQKEQKEPKQNNALDESQKSNEQIQQEKEEILKAIKNRSNKRQRNNQV